MILTRSDTWSKFFEYEEGQFKHKYPDIVASFDEDSMKYYFNILDNTEFVTPVEGADVNDILSSYSTPSSVMLEELFENIYSGNLHLSFANGNLRNAQRTTIAQDIIERSKKEKWNYAIYS